MRATFIVLGLACFAVAAGAQENGSGLDAAQPYPADAYDVAPPVPAAETDFDSRLADDEIDSLMASIALYPDPLLAVMLPACTYPADVWEAWPWLQNHPLADDRTIDAQDWDASVKAMTRYPEVLRSMAENMDWTQAVGVAFLNQPEDVMASIQRLRRAAFRAGVLVATAQQQIIVDGDMILILPADPVVVYVPQYNPVVVYVPVPYEPPPVVTYIACRTGRWLDCSFDWRHHGLSVGVGWHFGWVYENHRWRPDERPDIDHRKTKVYNRGFRKEAPAARRWSRDPVRPKPVLPAVLRDRVRKEHGGFPAAPATTPAPQAPRPIKVKPFGLPQVERPRAVAAPERPEPRPVIRPRPEVRPAVAPKPEARPAVTPTPTPRPRSAFAPRRTTSPAAAPATPTPTPPVTPPTPRPVVTPPPTPRPAVAPATPRPTPPPRPTPRPEATSRPEPRPAVTPTPTPRPAVAPRPEPSPAVTPPPTPTPRPRSAFAPRRTTSPAAAPATPAPRPTPPPPAPRPAPTPRTEARPAPTPPPATRPTASQGVTSRSDADKQSARGRQSPTPQDKQDQSDQSGKPDKKGK